ncbi:acc synthase [Hypoxylon sp. FL1150]|nr:acc synthase [Hypoxylon sp. FL1150]
MISRRATEWTKVRFNHGAQNAYDASTNPNGVVSFANAENWLVNEEIISFVNTHNQFDKLLSVYGEGFTGTRRLRSAMANHLNKHFKPAQDIDLEQITFGAGVTSLNEVCALITCDPNSQESIMLGRPIYGAFAFDLTMRTGVKLEYVDVGDTDQFSLDCVAAYEAGFEAAKARGVNIKAVILCNPHNPLGQCYPRETLIGLMRFCAAKNIHLISDEIYALSVYKPRNGPSENFTSIRAIDPTDIIDPSLVHVLYGMSKDFSSAGMRLGCVVSQNADFTKAARAMCRFNSPSQFSMDLAAKLLEDQGYVAKFLKKSQSLLSQSRSLAEELLIGAGIQFHRKGNAGFFMWLDMAPYLPTKETDGDEWAAERLLSRRFAEAGVMMSAGEPYKAPTPGRFRFVFCIKEDAMREGVRRISQVLSQKS